ncbi:MAG: RNA polymerase sigma factor [Caulobacteraceae bacterium]
MEWNRVLRKLDKLSGSRPASEDALQDAFVKLDGYRREHAVAHPKAFLVRVAINLALNERRRMSRRDHGDLSTRTEFLSDDQPLQDEVLAARERLHVVSTALMTLPARTREVFLMHRLEALRYKEIAERLAISVSAVEKHIARATLRLTDAMHRYEEEG